MVCTHLATAICCRCKLACRSGTVTHRQEDGQESARRVEEDGEQASGDDLSECQTGFVPSPLSTAPAPDRRARLTLLQLFVEQFELRVPLMDSGHSSLDDALEAVHLLSDQNLAAERMRTRPCPPLLQRGVDVHDGAGPHEHRRDVERISRGWGALLVHGIGGIKLSTQTQMDT